MTYLRRVLITKHPGPGGSVLHSTGTDQSVHGGGSGGRASPPLLSASDAAQETTSDLLATNAQRKPKHEFDAETVGAAGALFRRAVQTEEAVRPSIIKAARSTGASLAWYGERVKYEASIMSKLQRIIMEKADINTVEQASEDISDLNRYTFVWSTSDSLYRNGVLQVVDILQRDGWSFLRTKDGGVKVRDYWSPGDAYDGLHAVFERDGARVEVQFHTDRSLQKKQKSHVVYERYRELDPKSDEAKDLWQQMTLLWERRDHVPEVLPQLEYARQM